MAGITAPCIAAASMVRSMTSAVTNGRAASWTSTTSARGDTRAKPLTTESCRRTPPATTCTGLCAAGRTKVSGGRSTDAGTTTTISVTRACASNAPTARASIDCPPTSSSCFGVDPPKRGPLPPAAMMTDTNISRNLQRIDGARNHRANAIREGLGVRRRGIVERRRLNRIVDDQTHVCGLGPQAPFRPPLPRIDDRERRDRELSLDRQQEAAALEPIHAAVAAARPLGVNDQREALRHERAPAVQNSRAIRMRAIDEQMTAAAQVPAEHGKARERLLGDDAKLVRQRREHDGRVVNALMVRYEDVCPAGNDALEAFDGDANAGRLEDQPRPGARAAVREVAAAIEHARGDRRGAEDDRVDADGGDEIEGRPPPMEWWNLQP